jgi:hypothetical protein
VFGQILPPTASVVACLPLIVFQGEKAGNPTPPSSVPGSPMEAAVPAAVSDSLRVWLDVPRRVRAGEPVEMRIRARNISSEPVDLYLRGRTLTFDVVVARPDGTVVWHLLEDDVIPAVIRIETLAPGESLGAVYYWDQRSGTGVFVDPGSYTVRAEFLTETTPLVTPAEPLRILRE